MELKDKIKKIIVDNAASYLKTDNFEMAEIHVEYFVDEITTLVKKMSVMRCSTELPYSDSEIRGLLDKLVEDHYSNRPEKSTFALGFITCYNMLKVKQERNEAIT